jgi:hypothetical protein
LSLFRDSIACWSQLDFSNVQQREPAFDELSELDKRRFEVKARQQTAGSRSQSMNLERELLAELPQAQGDQLTDLLMKCTAVLQAQDELVRLIPSRPESEPELEFLTYHF